MNPVYIHDLRTISAAGIFNLEKMDFSTLSFAKKEGVVVFELNNESKIFLEHFLEKNSHFKKKSRTIQLVSSLFNDLKLDNSKKTLINIGSSRGNTDLWEKNHTQLIENNRVYPSSSPDTTAGSISHHLLGLLSVLGIPLDHSVTCGSGLQALANARAWILSGMSEQAIVGGSEAPLTLFTLEQFKSMGLYSKEGDQFPSRPLSLHKTQSYLCLGEAAGLCVIRKEEGPYKISGMGFGSEVSPTLSGITAEGEALQTSMKNACIEANIECPDAIIAHAPGTIKGDLAEIKAIEKCFGNKAPIFTNKHLCGHTLGASGIMSIAQAIAMLNGQTFKLPYAQMGDGKLSDIPKKILINATGFGGNAISLVVEKNELFFQ